MKKINCAKKALLLSLALLTILAPIGLPGGNVALAAGTGGAPDFKEAVFSTALQTEAGVSSELIYSNVAKRYLYDAKLEYNTLPGGGGSRAGARTAEAGRHGNFTAAGNLHIAYETQQAVNILALDRGMNKIRALTLPKEMPLFGDITGDEAGNFYVLYGKNVEETQKNTANVVLAKYNPDGRLIAKAEYMAGEINTKQPFYAANASLAISGDVLAAHTGRQMFRSADGLNHQSSLVLYADVKTMQPLQPGAPYTSHSFDQQVVPIAGGFLFADRGDAYPRGFELAKLENGQLTSVTPFHFREMQEYNFTNSELGGVAETNFSYVLVGSSDKILSNNPISRDSRGARNIFIQYIKKDFENYDVYQAGNDIYYVQGESRSAEGVAHSIGLNLSGISYFLPADATDHGVRWLTDLNENQNAERPKVVALSDGRVIVFWELFDRAAGAALRYAGTYYQVLDHSGEIIADTTLLTGSPRLPDNDRPVYLNGKIYWSFSDQAAGKIRVYELDIDYGLRFSHISGANRVLTSVAISRRGWRSADTVILAPGGANNLIDALAVAPLAGQENAPILLSTGTLDPAVAAEIQRLGATKVYAVGAVSQSVVNALRARLPNISIEALKGANRFETAALVGGKVKNPQGTFIVGYNAIADAVSAASFAAANGYIIQIANPDGGVSGAFGSPGASGGQTYILGGPALVRDVAGATRLYGPNRYETNKAIRAALSFEYANIYTANGETLVDALTGSVLAAQTNAAIVLAPGNDPAGADFGPITPETTVYAFGG
ncbi:MAG: cell wall-binding repeat-containing protein [Gracilibacteraceae bacterium]|jgi:hypothetical protein|nr:cell wall-binding repeat-containing protein [Gracilibacteraceae bacterium]